MYIIDRIGSYAASNYREVDCQPDGSKGREIVTCPRCLDGSSLGIKDELLTKPQVTWSNLAIRVLLTSIYLFSSSKLGPSRVDSRQWHSRYLGKKYEELPLLSLLISMNLF